MYDVQDLSTGDIVLELASLEELRSFTEQQFLFDRLSISNIVFEDVKKLLEGLGFKIYQID